MRVPESSLSSTAFALEDRSDVLPMILHTDLSSEWHSAAWIDIIESWCCSCFIRDPIDTGASQESDIRGLVLLVKLPLPREDGTTA